MNITQVWENLKNAILETDQRAENSLKDHYWSQGLAHGFRLSLHVLESNGVVPQEIDSAAASNDPIIIPFKPEFTQMPGK